jgi:hypothetical protein
LEEDVEDPMPGIIKRTWERFYRGWMAFARALGHANTILLLSVFYIVVIGPASLVVRILRKDPLRRRLRPAASYWLDKEQDAHSLENVRRQF